MAETIRITPIESGSGSVSNVGDGGFPDIEQEGVLVSSSESVLNFTNAVVVTDDGSKTSIAISGVVDGGTF